MGVFIDKMKRRREVKERNNAIIMALFMFQFGFMQPVASLVNSQVPIIFFTIILLVCAFINNCFKIHKHVLVIFILLTLLFGVNIIVFPSNMLTILPIYFEFLLKGYSAYIIGGFKTNGDELYSYFKTVGIVNFLAIFLYPFINYLDSMNYMRFGYAMIPSVLIFIIAFINETRHRVFWGIMFVISFLLNITYGSRGSLVVLLVFGFLLFLFSNKISKTSKWIVFLVSISVVYFVYRFNLLGKLFSYLYYNMDIKTYSIMKFYRMFNQGFLEASSGRDRIYSQTLKYIKENWAFGYGIGFSRTISGSTTHNLILQVLSEMGVFGALLWVMVIVYLISKLILIRNNNETNFYIIVIMISSLAIGRLLFSSDIWLRPELWFVISMLLSYKNSI